jgi:hypothetical protein
MQAMNSIDPKFRARYFVRGFRNGLHAAGYLYSHRAIQLDQHAGSVRRAWGEVGDLLDDATDKEANALGQKAPKRRRRARK